LYRVLLVDDEPFILDGLGRILDWAALGCEIVGTARSGEAALALMEKVGVDVLITDVKMPGMDGLALIARGRDIAPGLRSVVLSGYDDFAFVKRGILLGIDNYLLKPIDRDELARTIETCLARIEESHPTRAVPGADEVIREHILYRWALGRIGEDELIERCALLGLNAQGPLFRIGVLFSDLSQEGAFRAVAAKMREAGMPSVLDAAGRLVLFITGDESAIRRELRAACALAEGWDEGAVLLSLGREVSSASSVAASYSNALELSRFRLVAGGERVIDAEGPLARRSGVDPLFAPDYDAIDKALVGGDLGGALHAVESYLKDLAGRPQALPEQLLRAGAELSLRFARSGAREEAADSAMLLERLYRASSLPELIDIVSQGLRIAASEVAGNHGTPPSAIKEIVRLVNCHYDHDLSLKAIGAEYGMSPTYLGQAFRQETGEQFSLYLNLVRLRKAKELLETTRMKAVEIAETVGYRNPNYFYRVFRDLVGMSPTEYRCLRR
jgi:two-component system, response regulator YesN